MLVRMTTTMRAPIADCGRRVENVVKVFNPAYSDGILCMFESSLYIIQPKTFHEGQRSHVILPVDGFVVFFICNGTLPEGGAKLVLQSAF